MTQENIPLQLGEKIKSIQGYEDLYSITSYGRVWSYLRIRKGRNNSQRKYKARFLKLGLNRKTGYLSVNLYRCNRRKIYLVHRLVAQAFILNPLNLPEVNHKDTNKQNCKEDNLEWCTHQENQNHAVKLNLYKKETSEFYGVTFDKNEEVKNKPWRARVTINKKHIHIGRFLTELEAAKAYNSFVIEYNLNRPLNKIERE